MKDDFAVTYHFDCRYVHDGILGVIRHFAVPCRDVIDFPIQRHHLVQCVFGDILHHVLCVFDGMRLVFPQVIVQQEMSHFVVHHIDVSVHHFFFGAMVQFFYFVTCMVLTLFGARECSLEIEMVRTEVHH